MSNKKYTIPEKRIRLLYAAVDSEVMDKRIKIMKALKGVCHHTIYNEIDALLSELNRKAPQAAIDEFLNLKQ